MNRELIKYICCPYDLSDDWNVQWHSSENSGDTCFTGIVCKVCKRKYPLINGILSLMPEDFNTKDTQIAKSKRIEQRVRDEHADVYLDWFGPYTNSIEYEAICRIIKPDAEDTLVDLGCGVGRYTIPLSFLCKEIIAIDYSLKSLLVLKKEIEKNGIKNISLIQADITMMPLKANAFDKIVCSQVFTFLPGRESRSRAAQKVNDVLKPNGRLVLTVFNNHLYRKIKLLIGLKGAYAKEGSHPTHNFYYFNFSRWDLHSFLKESNFSVERIYGLCNFPREIIKDYQIKGHSKLIFWIDKLISKTFLSYLLGDLLIASVRKKV
jgi:ubiquinone/menaquinone biosynthesis C-methylase UbiE/uncharacterized protein YbaR (Trm112 family)